MAASRKDRQQAEQLLIRADTAFRAILDIQALSFRTKRRQFKCVNDLFSRALCLLPPSSCEQECMMNIRQRAANTRVDLNQAMVADDIDVCTALLGRVATDTSGCDAATWLRNFAIPTAKWEGRLPHLGLYARAVFTRATRFADYRLGRVKMHPYPKKRYNVKGPILMHVRSQFESVLFDYCYAMHRILQSEDLSAVFQQFQVLKSHETDEPSLIYGTNKIPNGSLGWVLEDPQKREARLGKRSKSLSPTYNFLVHSLFLSFFLQPLRH